MDVPGNTAELRMSAKTGARLIGARIINAEPASADGAPEVLRETIGRNVMTWISAGASPHQDVDAAKITIE